MTTNEALRDAREALQSIADNEQRAGTANSFCGTAARKALAAIANQAEHAEAGEAPAGWKLVPAEPTDEQIADAIEYEFSVTHEWPEGDDQVVRAFIKHFRSEA